MDAIRKTVTALIKEYEDVHAAYAAVCNNLSPVCPDEEVLAIKHYMEYLLACEAMEEYNWERDETGRWFKLENDEFWARLKAAHDKKNESGDNNG